MSPVPAPWDALAGQYRLHPGTVQSIAGQRPVLGAGRLGALLRGQRGSAVSATLGSVFTLCAHAHRRTADMALAAAAQTELQLPSTHAPVQLYLETARDHLRSIALDWPQRLPDLGDLTGNLGWLRGCPLPLAGARPLTDAAAWQALASLRDWLANSVLQQNPTLWLAAHRDPVALAAWCQAQAGRLLPARCLAAWLPMAQTLAPETRGLAVLSADPALQTAQLHQLAQSLANDADFAQRPSWLGQCAETGAWTRLRHQHGQVQHNAWTRLSARWLEFVEIAVAESATSGAGALTLASGALPLGPHQALAWCEMARGLLLHWVQLDTTGAVADYRVLAPTEWNFHPDGALARALSTLSADDKVAARTLAAAYDPCVACTV